MNIVIELPTWLGDTIMTIPAVQNLKKNNKSSKYIFLGSNVGINVYQNIYPEDYFLIIEKKYVNFYSFTKNLGNVDLFISFRNTFRSNIFSKLIACKEKYIYQRNIYTKGHQVEKYNNFISFVNDKKFQPEAIKLNSKSSKYINKEGKTIALNPGATYGEAKCWPKEKYAEIAFRLSDIAHILILGGNDSIKTNLFISDFLRKNNVTNFSDLSGKTSIQDLIDIIANVSILVTGDSGPMHIASAFQTPTISIFGPTDFRDTNQWKNKNDTIVKLDLDCMPCLKKVCPLGHHDCMQKIDKEYIIELINKKIL